MIETEKKFDDKENFICRCSENKDSVKEIKDET